MLSRCRLHYLPYQGYKNVSECLQNLKGVEVYTCRCVLYLEKQHEKSSNIRLVTEYIFLEPKHTICSLKPKPKNLYMLIVMIFSFSGYLITT